MSSKAVSRLKRWGATLKLPLRLWLVWLGASAVYVGVAAYCFGSHDQYRYFARWAWQGPVAFACLVYLHDRTLGRSSPAAAAAFLLGPLGAIVVLVFFAVQEAHRVAVHGHPGEQPAQLEVYQGAFLTVASGLGAACVVAILFAWATRDEWRHYHVHWEGTTEPVRLHPPACLLAFELTHNSTLADLNAAYRQKAKLVHPDLGGSAEDFRKLEQQYALAVKFLKRYGRPGPVASASSQS